MMNTKLLGAAALGLLVAACGTQPTERTTGGAAAGAATGATVGALGGPPGVLAGAAIGGVAGGATGALTSPDQVNLGRPPWNDPEVRVPAPGQTAQATGVSAQRDPQIRQLQQALNQQGFPAGPVDGIYGPQTRRAIENFQRARGMQATGQPDQQVKAALGVGGGTGMAADRDRAFQGGGMVGTGQTGVGAPGTAGGGMGQPGMTGQPGTMGGPGTGMGPGGTTGTMGGGTTGPGMGTTGPGTTGTQPIR